MISDSNPGPDDVDDDVTGTLVGDLRPHPMDSYIYTIGSDGMFLVAGEEKSSRTSNMCGCVTLFKFFERCSFLCQL
jgi:hypothetical protein